MILPENVVFFSHLEEEPRNPNYGFKPYVTTEPIEVDAIIIKGANKVTFLRQEVITITMTTNKDELKSFSRHDFIPFRYKSSEEFQSVLYVPIAIGADGQAYSYDEESYLTIKNAIK